MRASRLVAPYPRCLTLFCGAVYEPPDPPGESGARENEHVGRDGVPYFVKTLGCAVCIEVCPWSEPGQGPRLSEQLLARRLR